MPAHALNSATINFGLVSIPIQLYSASESSQEIHFNLLHDKCGSRLKQQYICTKDNEVVDSNHRIKGYEIEKNRYVTFTNQELKALEAASSYSIDIENFIPEKSIDPIYFDKAYYLGPDKGGDKAYHLLKEALAKTKHAAIARYAARGKDYLVMLRPQGDHLLLQQLHYANEIRKPSEVPIAGKTALKANELDLAISLIEQGHQDKFKPEQYKNETQKRIQQNIEKKSKGKLVIQSKAPEKQAKVIDLMTALKQSLKKAEKAPLKKKMKRSL